MARSMPVSEQTLPLCLCLCNHWIFLHFLCETGIGQVHDGSLAGMPGKGYHCLNPVVKRNPNHLDALAGRQVLALGHHRPSLPTNASITNRIPLPRNDQHIPMTYFGHVRQRGFSWDCNAPPIHFYIGNKLSGRQPPWLRRN